MWTSAAPTPSGKGTALLTNSTVRGLWLAITVLTAALIGVAAGVLAWVGGLNPPTAILSGGATFGGTVLLVLTVLRFAASGTAG